MSVIISVSQHSYRKGVVHKVRNAQGECSGKRYGSLRGGGVCWRSLRSFKQFFARLAVDVSLITLIAMPVLGYI